MNPGDMFSKHEDMENPDFRITDFDRMPMNCRCVVISLDRIAQVQEFEFLLNLWSFAKDAGDREAAQVYRARIEVNLMEEKR